MTWAEPGAAWTSGRWAIDRRGDELAGIRCDGVVVLRSVRLVVRDRDWGTAPLETTNVVARPAGLTLHVRGTGFAAGLTGTLEVTVDGASLRIAAEVSSARKIETNRLGLVVLHPLEVAGAPLTVTHADGTLSRTRFPVEISPHQPAFDIGALSWEHAGGTVTTSFAGDVFEMEDQRNWTDASFKTYNRPLDRPFPYAIAAGETVAQQVVVTVSGSAAPSPRDADDEIALEPSGRVPDIGVGAATAPDPATAAAPAGSFVRVELDLASPAWRAALARAAASGRPLDVRLVRADVVLDQLDAAVAALLPLPVLRVGAFADQAQTRHLADSPTVERLRAALRTHGLDVPVVGGVRTHFTELNRGGDLLSTDVDAVGFALTPLFHDRSTAQLVESVPVQRAVAAQAVRLADGLPVHVGPVTLRPHVDAVATTPEPTPASAGLDAGYGPALLDADDPRQTAPQLAAWTIASLAALSLPGVASVTFFEQWGPRGLADAHGVDHPAAQAVRAVTALAGAPASAGRSRDGRVWALRADTVTGPVTLIANLDEVDRRIRLRGPQPMSSFTIPASEWRRLDAP